MTWLTLLAAVLLAAAAVRQAAAHPRVRAAYRFSGHRGATPAWADELRRWNADTRRERQEATYATYAPNILLEMS